MGSDALDIHDILTFHRSRDLWVGPLLQCVAAFWKWLPTEIVVMYIVGLRFDLAIWFAASLLVPGLNLSEREAAQAIGNASVAAGRCIW